MGTFYDCNSARISLREYWWGTKSPAVIVGWISKWLGVRIPSSTDDPNVETLAPFEIPREQLPEELASQVAALEGDFHALGFHTAVCHLIRDAETHTVILMITLRHESGTVLGRVFHRDWRMPHPPRIYLAPQFITVFEDGSYLVSSALKPDMLAPPECPVNRVEKATAATLFASHQAALIRPQFAKPVRSVTTVEEIRNVSEHFHALHRDFHVKRRVFVPRVAPSQPAPLDLAPAASAAAVDGGGAAMPPPLPGFLEMSRHPEIHAEMRRLQQARSGSWGKAVLTLVVTIAIFAGAGAAAWSWDFVLALIPILFFHELGHFAAMKVFRYRNLKMFFIPLFGAAVTGHHYNVAGWKKALVSLAGPVPGILAGIVLGAIGMALHQDWLLNAAFLMLILNGFNLLPVLPLDGGWVLHSVLFSRHYLLDVAFRAVAGIALLAGFMVLDDRVLMALGIFMLLGIQANWRTGKVTHEVKQSQLPTVPPDSETIPTDTADRIIGGLKTAFPKGANAKTIAQMTLGIFESLNARPPGWFASALLLGVHIGSLALAVVFSFIFVVAKQGDVLDFLDMAASAPQQAYDCHSLVETQGVEFTRAAGSNPMTLIGGYPDHSSATAAFAVLTRELPPQAAVRQFGQTLLLAVPADRDDLRADLVARLERTSTNVFATSSNLSWSVSISVVAQSVEVAERLERLLGNFASAPAHAALVPPWMPADPRSKEERAQHELARWTYRELNQVAGSVYTNAEYRTLIRRSATARRQGDLSGAESLGAEAQSLASQLRTAAIQKLQLEGGATLDPETIRRYLNVPDQIDLGNLELRRDRLADLSERMGRIDRLPEASREIALSLAASGGYPRRVGQALTVGYSRHESAFHGVPALADWLCDQGCLDIKYEFHSYGFGLDEVLEE